MTTTNGTHHDNEPGLFDEPAAPALPPAFPQLRLTTTVRHESSGFVFQVEFNDTPISAVVSILQKRGCVPATASTPAARASGVTERGADGVPICPKHGQKMKVSQYGGYFCTAADPDTTNGKCKEKVKE